MNVPPSQNPRDARNIIQPIKRLHGRVTSSTHITQEPKRARHQYTVYRETLLGASPKYPRDLTFQCESVQNTAGGVDVGITGRPGGDENDGVDDGWKGVDACVLDGDDEGRGGGVAAAVDEAFVVVRYQYLDISFQA